MLPVRILAASVVAVGTNAAASKYAEEQGLLGYTDTSFLTRTTFLAGALLSVLAFMWPTCPPARVQGFFLAWPVVLTASVLMYITKEPILVVFPVIAAAVGLCRAVRETRAVIGVAPFLIPAALAAIVFTFFFAGNQFFDDIRPTNEIDPAAMPEGYVSSHPGSMANHPLLLTVLIFVTMSIAIANTLEARASSIYTSPMLVEQ